MATNDTPQTVSPNAWSRIMRFGPLIIVGFCISLLVTVAFISPFGSPEPELSFHDNLVGSGYDPTGAYTVIRNGGGADKLLSASTPAAKSVKLQSMSTPSVPTSNPNEPAPAGVLLDVEYLDIPGFDDLRLQPGSNQFLLVGLTAALADGQTVELTLQFEKAGTIVIQAIVANYSDIADQLLPPRLKLNGQ